MQSKLLSLRCSKRDSGVAPWVKALSTKSVDISLTPGTHIVEGET